MDKVPDILLEVLRESGFPAFLNVLVFLFTVYFGRRMANIVERRTDDEVRRLREEHQRRMDELIEERNKLQEKLFQYLDSHKGSGERSSDRDTKQGT